MPGNHLLALVLAVWTFGSSYAAANTDHLETGRVLYNFHCYFCHGYSGDAATLAASYLDPRPRNFRASDPDELTRESMLDSVTRGRQLGSELVDERRLAYSRDTGDPDTMGRSGMSFESLQQLPGPLPIGRERALDQGDRPPDAGAVAGKHAMYDLVEIHVRSHDRQP